MDIGEIYWNSNRHFLIYDYLSCTKIKKRKETTMKKNIICLGSIILLVILSGCGTMGTFRADNLTNVELSEANFNIIARNVQGSAMQGYIFGISAAQSFGVGTFGLVRVSGVEKPYDSAMKDLWNKFQQDHGSIEGRKLALINIRQDNEVLNTFIYTEARYFITADIIEFIE